ADTTQGCVGVLLNTGGGTFGAPALHALGLGCWTVAAADLDGDGRPDLVTTSSAGVSVLLNTGGGQLAAPVDYTPVGFNLAIADVNGDGHPDLVTDAVDVLLNLGGGTFGAPVHYPAGFDIDIYGVAVADLDGDSNLDIVVGDFGTNGVVVHFGHGD